MLPEPSGHRGTQTSEATPSERAWDVFVTGDTAPSAPHPAAEEGQMGQSPAPLCCAVPCPLEVAALSHTHTHTPLGLRSCPRQAPLLTASPATAPAPQSAAPPSPLPLAAEAAPRVPEGSGGAAQEGWDQGLSAEGQVTSSPRDSLCSCLDSAAVPSLGCPDGCGVTPGSPVPEPWGTGPPCPVHTPHPLSGRPASRGRPLGTCLPGWSRRFTTSCCLKWRKPRSPSLQVSAEHSRASASG